MAVRSVVSLKHFSHLYFADICGAGTANSIVCQNDGTCSLNTDGDWTCNCTRGWTGPYCMLHVCGAETSASLICAHEGTCVHSAATGAFACACQHHWSGADCSGMKCTEPDITCYNQVEFDAKICTASGCDCLNDGYGGDCRGVRCGSGSSRCFNGAVCINFERGLCSACAPGFNGSDCSQSKSIMLLLFSRLAIGSASSDLSRREDWILLQRRHL